MAVPFDVSKLEIAGSPRELKSNVLHALNTENDSWETAVGHYDVAPNGTLIYAAAGSNKQLPRTVAWVDRSGVSTPIEIDPRYYNSARVSPDGSSLLLWEWGTNKDDGAIWTLDLKRGGTRRELGKARYLWFAWGPESNQITGGRYTETDSELIAARAGADSGQPTVLPFSRPFHYVSEWSRDGQLLVCVGGNAIWLCPRGKVCQQIPKREDVVEQYPAISPDGRWLAFASNESSRPQVYVRSLTDLESIQQVSFTGGEQPVWSRDGSELYFCSLGGTKKSFYAVGIETAAKGSLSIGEPTLLFTLSGVETTVPIRNWDVAPDGRFVFTMVPAPELRSAFYKQRCPDRIHIVQNWPSKLDR